MAQSSITSGPYVRWTSLLVIVGLLHSVTGSPIREDSLEGAIIDAELQEIIDDAVEERILFLLGWHPFKDLQNVASGLENGVGHVAGDLINGLHDIGGRLVHGAEAIRDGVAGEAQKFEHGVSCGVTNVRNGVISVAGKVEHTVSAPVAKLLNTPLGHKIQEMAKTENIVKFGKWLGKTLTSDKALEIYEMVLKYGAPILGQIATAAITAGIAAG